MVALFNILRVLDFAFNSGPSPPSGLEGFPFLYFVIRYQQTYLTSSHSFKCPSDIATIFTQFALNTRLIPPCFTAIRLI